MTSARKELEAAADEIEAWEGDILDKPGAFIIGYVAEWLRIRASRLPASTWTVEMERGACAAELEQLGRYINAADYVGSVWQQAAKLIRSRTTPTATTEKEIGE